MYMYKIDRNVLPSYVIKKIKRATVSNYTIRNAQNYSIQKCHLELYKFLFVRIVVNQWNIFFMRFQRMSVKVTLSAFLKKKKCMFLFKMKIYFIDIYLLTI